MNLGIPNLEYEINNIEFQMINDDKEVQKSTIELGVDNSCVIYYDVINYFGFLLLLEKKEGYDIIMYLV